ncbi:tetratricopeptide repeat protein [Endozoicomonas sp. SCSIO W0465]|uniref:YfgM family protein n=1 Tax=Endozoicomonas sp. SCSIO W0465 TaxID=2918516 RepID=UPI002074FF41|nr:tetratricopeptide repeat protein [Endozoicomonas sp. SCSIO W0465]USE39018.1 tetratricopeptide repeat protein [Endozoicomonas sp. SCSIO W0465]
MSYQSDEEQVELLKNLWKDYGQPVVLGVAITLAAVSGYQYWQKTQQQEIAAASTLYQNLLDTISNGSSLEQQAQFTVPLTEEQKATISHVVSSLQADHTSSQYAAFATLFLAQQQVQDNQLSAARASLEWVLAQKPAPEVQAMASVRLARVLLSESSGNGQQALDILTRLNAGKSYEATVESAKGDAYLALGDRKLAETAYRKAVDAAQNNGLNRPLLQLKLDDLAAMAPQMASQEG